VTDFYGSWPIEQSLWGYIDWLRDRELALQMEVDWLRGEIDHAVVVLDLVGPALQNHRGAMTSLAVAYHRFRVPNAPEDGRQLTMEGL
jgi:hypothetical protein